MLHFEYHMPTRIIFGPDKLEELGTTPHLPKGNKAMIVIGESGAMIKAGYLARVQGLLANQGVSSLVYDRICPNPESAQIEEAAKIARDEGIQFIVGLGGGSSMDAAKAIALLAANGGEMWDYMVQGTGKMQTPEHPSLPMICIPTTAGTGSEADRITVVTQTGTPEKIAWVHDSIFPHLSIVDPKLTLSVSPIQTAFTGMDAFFHAVETYLNIGHQPASDTLALEAVHLIANTLPEAVIQGDSLEARTIMSWASTAGGLCMAYSRCISHHTLEATLSGYYPELPHGAGLVLLAPAYFGFLAENSVPRLGDLALSMGTTLEEELPEGEEGQAFCEAMKTLIESVGLSEMSFSDYDIDPSLFPEMADHALNTGGLLFGLTPVEMTREDIITIFERAYNRTY